MTQSAQHLVRKAADAAHAIPGGWASTAAGYRRWSVVDERCGSVHTGFGICTLEPVGFVPTHVHSFEESFYVVEGAAIVDTPDGSFQVQAGDYGLFPPGVAHAWRAKPGTPDTPAVRWAEMQGPVPRERFNEDTFVVPPLRVADAAPVDVRDPRTRSFGNITPDHMDPTKQSQDLLAVSASMRTALLVYSGITVKMMVDSDLGAQLTTMFMVQYEPDGMAGPHDHPLEETYFFLEGEAEATFDGKRYVLGPGDVAWAGVGCVHSFRNLRGGPLRWLETQSPQPPRRHTYRYARDWEYLQKVLAEQGGSHG